METTLLHQKSGTLTSESVFVFFGDHDKGCKPGFMVREGWELAERTARLMSECGYRFVDTRHAFSMAEMFEDDAAAA